MLGESLSSKSLRRAINICCRKIFYNILILPIDAAYLSWCLIRHKIACQSPPKEIVSSLAIVANKRNA